MVPKARIELARPWATAPSRQFIFYSSNKLQELGAFLVALTISRITNDRHTRLSSM